MNQTETTNDVAPNQTIYINNLNEKVKLDELKQSLYYLCSQYGEVIDIVAKKNIKMRGQAFIVFKDVNAATAALKALNEFNFFDKTMRVTFAKQKSDAVAKMDGTFIPREKPKMKIETKKAAPTKKIKTDVEATNQLSKAPKETKVTQKSNIIVPNNILFVENIPAVVTNEMLIALFQQYIGFREVRYISTKNLAFVEYDDELQAGIALSGLNGFKMTADSALQISYAKK